MESYSRAAVARLLRVEPRKLEGWVARGVLKPMDTEPGTGNPHRFTLPEIIRAAILLETQESFGPQFIKPGKLATLLREHVTDRRLEAEREHVERTPWTPRTPRGGMRLPAGEPGDLILHISKDLLSDDDEPGGRQSRRLALTLTTRKREHIWPRSYVVLRVEVGPIVRSLLWRLARQQKSP